MFSLQQGLLEITLLVPLIPLHGQPNPYLTGDIQNIHAILLVSFQDKKPDSTSNSNL